MLRYPNQLRPKCSAEDVYEVEAILDHDFKFNVLYYLAHWKGHSHIYANDWSPRTELHRSTKQTLNKYENKHGIDISKPDSHKGNAANSKRKRVTA